MCLVVAEVKSEEFEFILCVFEVLFHIFPTQTDKIYTD